MDQPLDLTSQDDDLVELPAGDLETRGRARKQTSPKKVIIDNQEFDVAEPRVVQQYISAPPPFNQQSTSSELNFDIKVAKNGLFWQLQFKIPQKLAILTYSQLSTCTLVTIFTFDSFD